MWSRNCFPIRSTRFLVEFVLLNLVSVYFFCRSMFVLLSILLFPLCRFTDDCIQHKLIHIIQLMHFHCCISNHYFRQLFYLERLVYRGCIYYGEMTLFTAGYNNSEWVLSLVVWTNQILNTDEYILY